MENHEGVRKGYLPKKGFDLHMTDSNLESSNGPPSDQERGFTIIEVAVASVITMVGMVLLAGLFTLAITHNRIVKQYTATTALSQQKMEELNAIDKNDTRLVVGGGLTDAAKQTGYWDKIYVDDAGTVSTTIPTGQVANYVRYWKIENDPSVDRTVIISVRVTSLQPGRGNKPEETVLVSVRSW
jgi:Tfp pilus assembly protein PilV